MAAVTLGPERRCASRVMTWLWLCFPRNIHTLDALHQQWGRRARPCHSHGRGPRHSSIHRLTKRGRIRTHRSRLRLEACEEKELVLINGHELLIKAWFIKPRRALPREPQGGVKLHPMQAVLFRKLPEKMSYSG